VGDLESLFRTGGSCGDCQLFDTPDAMKLQYLLLFAASALLIDPVQIVNSAPARIAYESRSQDASQIFQQVNPAVVTVYAGGEIGSGSIVSSEGYVITNNHVVRRSSQVVARMADGRRIPGQVIATDARNDLALIKLNASQLPTVPIASSNGIQPGQPVIAIGSPYGRPGVMTQGTFRSVRGNGDLQSQVVLEPGNSGGPLLNTRGEMVGVNKAILESARGSNTGISIATSAARALEFINRSIPGGLSAGSAPYASQPQFLPSQNQPTYSTNPYNDRNNPAIATLPSTVPQTQPNTRWGYPTPQPLPNSAWGRSATPPMYESGGTVRRNERGDVVVPSFGDPWQAAQAPQGPYSTTPGFTDPGVANPGYAMPTTPDAQYPEPFANAVPETYPNTAPSGGARLGVVVDTRTMMIQQVQPGTAGANSGLRVGDRLLAVNGSQLQSFEQLQAFMNQAPPTAAFTISRRGRAATVQVKF